MRRVRTILLSAAVVLLALLLTLLVILRRGGRGGVELIGPQVGSVRGTNPPSAARREPLDPMLRRRVEDLAAAGRRLQAIALIREATDLRVAEAKLVVDTFSRVPRRPAGSDTAHQLFDVVRELAYSGRQAEAIAILRDRAGMSEEAARQAVEQLGSPG